MEMDENGWKIMELKWISLCYTSISDGLVLTKFSSAAQKIKKLSETPATVPIVAKSCKNDSKNRKIAEKLVQPVTPHHGCFQWGLQWGNS